MTGQMIQASVSRNPSSLTRTGVEGGVFAAAAVVAADVAARQFVDVQGVAVLAAAIVGALGAWLASVARNVASEPSTPRWVKIVLGVNP